MWEGMGWATLAVPHKGSNCHVIFMFHFISTHLSIKQLLTRCWWTCWKGLLLLTVMVLKGEWNILVAHIQSWKDVVDHTTQILRTICLLRYLMSLSYMPSVVWSIISSWHCMWAGEWVGYLQQAPQRGNILHVQLIFHSRIHGAYTGFSPWSTW